MKAKHIVITALLVALAIAVLPVAVAADSSSAPQLPAQIYGTVVDKNGVTLPVGTVITATVDGREFTYTVTEEGKIGEPGTFGEKFLVHGENAGSKIEFSVNGEPAGELTSYTPGKSMEFDLSFPVDADNLSDSAVSKPSEKPSSPDTDSSENQQTGSENPTETVVPPVDTNQTTTVPPTETEDLSQTQDVPTDTPPQAGDTGNNPVEALPPIGDIEHPTDVQTPGFPFGLLMGALAFAVFLSRRE